MEIYIERQLTTTNLHREVNTDLEFTTFKLLVKKVPKCGWVFVGRECGKASFSEMVAYKQKLRPRINSLK